MWMDGSEIWKEKFLKEIVLDVVEWNHYLLKHESVPGKYLSLQIPVVTLCTTRVDIQKFSRVY
jgi:hypothetical protein